jgi:hypothetical protein
MLIGGFFVANLYKRPHHAAFTRREMLDILLVFSWYSPNCDVTFKIINKLKINNNFKFNNNFKNHIIIVRIPREH